MLGIDTWIRLHARLLAMHPKFNRTSMACKKKFTAIFKVMTYFITIKIERIRNICSLLESMAKEGERGKIQKICAFKRLKLAWELPNDMGHGPSTRPLGLHTTTTQTPPTKYYNIFLQCQNSAPQHTLVFHGVRPLG